MSLRSRFWQVRYSRWGRAEVRRPGYTLLIPVPGDLPVFLELALKVCARQVATSRVETLVLTDLPTPRIAELVAAFAPDWPGPLRQVRLPALDRAVLPRLGDPGRNHGSQIITGVGAALGTHVVLHDADLFLLRDDAHEAQYQLAIERRLVALGVSPPWDPWYAAHDLDLAATWELCAEVEWLRRFPPWRHFGHDAELFGEHHTFDTTFWAQCHTPGDRIAVHGAPDDLVHFNYVISTYRAFQKRSGPFLDDNFRLLLIRLLVDLFDTSHVAYALPTLGDMAAGLGTPSAAVWYRPELGETYGTFRSRLDAIVAGPWSPADRRDEAYAALEPFDSYFGWTTGS